MDNRLANQFYSRNLTPSPENPDVGGLYRYTPGPEPDPQSLESSFSALNLSSDPHPHPYFPPPGFRRPLSAGGGDQHFSPLQRMRVQSALNGQMGFGGAHMDPTVMGVSSHPIDDLLVSDFGSFLYRKKQLGNKIKTRQFPILPCSNRTLNRFPQSSVSSFCLGDLRGQIVDLAKDQFGCRLLQAKFEEDPKEEEIEMVLCEVIDHVGELMRDQFGNYLIQKLVGVCNEKQRTRIILSMTKTQFQLISICLNPHGTRAVQRLLEHITKQEQINFVMSALSPGAVVLATDPNGHHVIDNCLILFSSEDNKYLLNEIANNCFEIATNKSGCCVLKSCVEHSRGKHREHLLAKIIANALHLAEDPYGNYVVQHLLELKIPEVTQNLLRQLEGSYAYLSCNKYASNVVEKFLIESREEQSSRIILELLRSPNASMLLVDPYGNFVIQSALSVSKGLVRSALHNLVRLNAPFMCTNLYGKKVLSCLTR